MTASDWPNDEEGSGSSRPYMNSGESWDEDEDERIDLSVLKEGYRPIPYLSYRLTKRLDDDKSGFGQVWKAYSDRPRRTVVFKFCKRPFDPACLQTLHNELRLVRDLDHPGIVKLEAEYLDSQIPFLQYEFIDGVDLSKLLRERFGASGAGPLPPVHAAALILKLVNIMKAAHSCRLPIVHRDLKPENVLVSNYHDLCVFKELGVSPDLRLARLKVMDFGIGAHSRYGQGATTGSQSIGRQFEGFRSYAYASPQQDKGWPAHESDDVYAIGVIWYELLAGEMGEGPPIGQLWTRKRKELKLRGMTEEQLDVLERCLEPSREHRIQNAIKLAEEIRGAYERPDEVLSLSDQIAEALTTWKGDTLSLDGLTSVSVEVAEALGKWNGSTLSLNGLTELPDDVAEALARWKGHQWSTSPPGEGMAGFFARLNKRFGDGLSLNGLKSLSVKATEALARWKGRGLYLNGLTELPDDVAEALARWKGRRLYLNGLTELPDDVAEALARWHSDRSYTAFPVEAGGAARWEARFRHPLLWLHLNGVNSLSVKVTEALAKWKGESLILNPKLLRLAAEDGGLEITRFLLNRVKCNCNDIDQDGWTPLLLAAKNGHWEIVKVLVAANADVNVKTVKEGNTPLHYAALAGNAEIIELLLKKGADIAGANSEGKRPLDGLTTLSVGLASALAGWNGKALYLNGLTSLHADVARTLAKWKGIMLHLDGLTSLSVGAAEALAGWTGDNLSILSFHALKESSIQELQAHPELLRSAAERGGIGMARFLLGTAEVDPNASDEGGWTPLLLASKSGQWIVVKLLIEANADINVGTKKDGNTPLHLAAMAGNAEIIELLLKKGADVAGANSEGKRPLDCMDDTCLNGLTELSIELARALAEWKGEALYLSGLTSLPVDVANALAGWKGARLHLNGLPSLSVKAAGALARAKVSRCLLLNGLNSLDAGVAEALAGFKGEVLYLNGLTSLPVEDANALAGWKGEALRFGGLASESVLPLHAHPEILRSAAEHGGVGMVRFLLGMCKMAPDISDREGWTPLLLASKNGHRRIVEVLVEANADVNVKTVKEGNTPLHYAAMAGKSDVVKLLLEKGADLVRKNLEGWTPLLLASKNGHRRIVEVLVEANADVNVNTVEEGNTPLHYAAMAGNAAVVNLLLEKGADPGRKNSEGKTPLHCAADSGDIDTIRLLLPKT